SVLVRAPQAGQPADVLLRMCEEGVRAGLPVAEKALTVMPGQRPRALTLPVVVENKQLGSFCSDPGELIQRGKGHAGPERRLVHAVQADQRQIGTFCHAGCQAKSTSSLIPGINSSRQPRCALPSRRTRRCRSWAATRCRALLT